MTKYLAAISLISSLLLLPSCRVPSSTKPAAPPSPDSYFISYVKPIFEQSCLQCHNGVAMPGKLNLSTKATAFSFKKFGTPFIVPGQPDKSLLISAVSRQGTHPKLMPQKDVSLTDDEIGTLREWIEDGAHWPLGEQGNLSIKIPQ